jgi:hypothetical protein
MMDWFNIHQEGIHKHPLVVSPSSFYAMVSGDIKVSIGIRVTKAIAK